MLSPSEGEEDKEISKLEQEMLWYYPCCLGTITDQGWTSGIILMFTTARAVWDKVVRYFIYTSTEEIHFP